VIIGDDRVAVLHVCSEIGCGKVPTRLGFGSIVRREIRYPENHDGCNGEWKKPVRQGGGSDSDEHKERTRAQKSDIGELISGWKIDTTKIAIGIAIAARPMMAQRRTEF
jgi:hypothetical protein